MFILTHAAVGAVIARVVPGQPWAIAALAFAAHFLADIIPHGDSELYNDYVSGAKVKRAIAIVTVDALVSLAFAVFLLISVDPAWRFDLGVGILAGVLPDLLVAIYELSRSRFLAWFHRLHFFFHNLVTSRTGDLSLRNGFIVEFIAVAVLFLKLF